MEEIVKNVSDSESSMVQIILAEHVNGRSRLFGGQILSWMDLLAGVVARRHSNKDIATVCIDDLQFRAPAHLNDTVALYGKLVYVGNSSMEVRIDAFTESLNGTRTLINTAYFSMVALDENERPVRVPRLIPKTEEELQEWNKAKKRKEYRDLARKARLEHDDFLYDVLDDVLAGFAENSLKRE